MRNGVEEGLAEVSVDLLKLLMLNYDAVDGFATSGAHAININTACVSCVTSTDQITHLALQKHGIPPHPSSPLSSASASPGVRPVSPHAGAPLSPLSSGFPIEHQRCV